MRWILRFIGALFALALLVLGVLWFRLDFIAQRMIERTASERLGVRTEVGSLLLRPFSGILSLGALRIANPPGYDGDFLSAEEVRGELDVSTLRNEVIEVREVTLSGVDVTLEEGGKGSNYDAIVANLHAHPKPAASEAGPSVRIHDLYVRDITAHVKLGGAPALSLQIPEIQLHDLGGPGGTDAGEVTAVVVREILITVATRAPGMPFELAAGILRSLGLGSVVDVLKEAGERGLDALKGLLHEATH
jgi:hypothetical protein